MKDLNTILERINKATEDYEVMQLKQTSEQANLLREFSCLEEWLGQWVDHYEGQWLNAYENFDHKVHARKEAHANNVVREYRITKRIYDRLISKQKAIGSTLKYA